jgi:hypothetical protein
MSGIRTYICSSIASDQRTRRREDLLIGQISQDRAPIAHVENRGEGISAQSRLLDRGAEPYRRDTDADDRDQSGRQQTSESSFPEVRKIHSSEIADFTDEERRDQKARQSKKDRNPEKSPGEPSKVGVKDEDEDDGNSSKTVESGPVVDLQRGLCRIRSTRRLIRLVHSTAVSTSTRILPVFALLSMRA